MYYYCTRHLIYDNVGSLYVAIRLFVPVLMMIMNPDDSFMMILRSFVSRPRNNNFLKLVLFLHTRIVILRAVFFLDMRCAKNEIIL